MYDARVIIEYDLLTWVFSVQHLNEGKHLDVFKLLEKHFETHFEELKETEEGDWLSEFKELGQSVKSYTKRSEYRYYHNRGL